MSQMITMFLAQTYKKCELIIVDDASTDGTEDLCSFYTAKYKNIKYFKNLKNLGVADSRNIARSHSIGDILLVQDADDQSVNGRAELTAEFFKKNKKIDLMYGSNIIIDDLGKERATQKAEDFVVSRLKTKNYISHPTLAYRKSMPIMYRKGLKYIDDWYFTLDCYNAGYKFGHIDNILSAWRVTRAGLSYDMGKEEGWKKEAKEKLIEEFKNIEDDITKNLKNPEQRIRLKEIAARIPKGSTILDVGCNGGYTMEIYAKKGTVTGIEIAPNLIEICRKKGLNVVSDYPVNTLYDIVVVGDVLEHYNEIQAKHIANAAFNSATDRVIITIPYVDGRYCKKFVPEHKEDYSNQQIASWFPNSRVEFTPIYYGDDAIPLWSLIEVFK